MGGLPSYIPGGQFAFPRSYVAGLEVRHDGPFLYWDGVILRWIVAGSPNALVEVTFVANFEQWSSNRWTLDHIILNATYEYPPNPTQYELPYHIIWRVPPGKHSPHILLDAHYGENYSTIALPSQPAGYWLAPPLPD